MGSSAPAGAASVNPFGTAGAPSGGAEQVHYQTVNATMEVKASYQAFKDFLRDLESSIRITDIQTISLIPETNGFNFKLSLNTYYQ